MSPLSLQYHLQPPWRAYKTNRMNGSKRSWRLTKTTWLILRMSRLFGAIERGQEGEGSDHLHYAKQSVEWGMLKLPLFTASGALALGALAGCASPVLPPLRTVRHVDMDRYLGRWYVIANIPYFLENGKVASYDTYARRSDGKLDNIFTFRKGGFDAPEQSWHGTAWVTNTTTNAEWKVRFIWPFSSTYLVLELDPDYRWAVVGTPGRGLLWILARERQMSALDYEHVITIIERQGYNRSKIVPVPQPTP
jgi:apolipoprotein D and lipocalin family protein